MARLGEKSSLTGEYIEPLFHGQMGRKGTLDVMERGRWSVSPETFLTSAFYCLYSEESYSLHRRRVPAPTAELQADL